MKITMINPVPDNLATGSNLQKLNTMIGLLTKAIDFEDCIKSLHQLDFSYHRKNRISDITWYTNESEDMITVEVDDIIICMASE